jgi:RimJ/RimL family protein N-acetyltransferase
MTAGDLPMVSEWMFSPEVRQWYYSAGYTDREQAERHYHEEMSEVPRSTWHYVIQIGGIDAGFIQTYLVCSYPEFNEAVQADTATAMIDLFLSNEFMHKGHGRHIMEAFLRQIVFSGAHFDADKCAIGPEPKNLAAIRMYEKAGFRWVKTIQAEDEDEPEYIMMINKHDVFK